MNKSTSKKLDPKVVIVYLGSVSLVILALLLVFSLILGDERIPDGCMEIHVIDVGQGDCTMFMTNNSVVIFDSGTNESENSLRAYLKNLGIKKIDCIIFTHPHDDHIGGADMILREFDIKKMIITDAEGEGYSYESLKSLLNENTEVLYAEPMGEYWVGDMRLTTLVSEDNELDLNGLSIVTRLDFGSNSFLITGDAEAMTEAIILETFGRSILDCDFLKVGHHGSDTSSSVEFLNAVTPVIATISCAEGNSYGHPSLTVIDRLSLVGAEVLRTDELGTIVLLSDGRKISKID